MTDDTKSNYDYHRADHHQKNNDHTNINYNSDTDKRKKLMRKNNIKSSSTRSLSNRKTDNNNSSRNLMKLSPSNINSVDYEHDPSASETEDDEEEEYKLRSNNRNNLRVFGIDLNLSGEALHEPSPSQSPSSSTFDPRRWSAAVVPDKSNKIINASYFVPAQKSQKRLKKKQPKPKKQNNNHDTTNNGRGFSSGRGPKFVPPKSNDFVPPCSYMPELPRWNFLDRLSEEVAPHGFFKRVTKTTTTTRDHDKHKSSSSRRRSLAG